MNVITYADWYEQPGNDVYRGRYQEVYTNFDANEPPLRPGELLNRTISADAKWAFVALSSTGTVSVYHRIRCMPALPMVDRGPQDDLNVALLGDVSDFGTPFVVFPEDAFHRTAVLDRILAPASITARIALHPGEAQTTVDPAVGDAELRPVRTRFFMWIPMCVVGQILRATSQGPLWPRDLWSQIAAPLLQDEVLGPQCVPFLDWCRAAYSGGIGGDNPVRSAAPTAIVPTGRLAEFRLQVLRIDLPDRYTPRLPPPPPPPPAPVQQLDADQLEAVLNRAGAAQEPAVTTPSGRWPEGIDRLYLLCGVNEDEYLPPVWHALARDGNKKYRLNLQFFLERPDDRLGPVGRAAVKTYITSMLAGDLGNLRFTGESVDLISSGLSIFAVSFPTQDSVACLRRAVELYDQQMMDVQHLSLQEGTTLRDDQKHRLPTTWHGLKKVVFVYVRLLTMVLGIEHPLTRALIPVATVLSDEYDDQLITYFNNSVHRCGGLLREIQIGVYHWITDTFEGRHVEVPQFTEPFRLIRYNRWDPPPIPGVTGQPPNPPNASGTGTPRNAARTAPTNRVVAVRGHLDRTLIPHISNFQPKTYIGAHGLPPNNDKGTAFCLFYHCVEHCVSDCQRSEDHRKHNKAESQRLADYLKTAITALSGT